MKIQTDRQAAIQSFLDSISIEGVKVLADSVIKDSFEDLLARLNADAGAVWIVADGADEITIAVNVGLRGSEVEGKINQKLDRGLVSKAYRSEEIVSDEGLLRNAEKSTDVDRKLGQMTAYQIAAPFKLFGKTIGAVTVAQMVTTENTNTKSKQWGFTENAADSVGRWVGVAQRLFEYELVKSTESVPLIVES